MSDRVTLAFKSLPSPLIALATMGLVTAAAHAGPSFDCSQATAPDERAICASDDLARRDQLANAAFNVARARPDIHDEALRLTRASLLARRDCGSDPICIGRSQDGLVTALLTLANVRRAEPDSVQPGAVESAPVPAAEPVTAARVAQQTDPVSLAKPALPAPETRPTDQTTASAPAPVIAPGKTDPDYVAEPTGDETDSGNADAETFAARPANSIRIDAVTWTAWNHQLTPVQAAAVRNGVLEKLRDPQSAVFSKAGALVSSRGLVLICGYVNAKNGFGGYAGMTLYSAELIGERVGVVDVDLGPVDVCRNVRF
jgi:uncharacterized protein